MLRPPGDGVGAVRRLAGPLTARRRSDTRPRRRPGQPVGGRRGRVVPWLGRPRAWVPGVVAVLVGLAGVLNIVSAVTPGLAGRVHELRAFLPGGVTSTATAATVVAGVLLVCLSVALRRRKRRAYQAVVAVLAVSIVLNLVKGFDVEEAAVETALLTVVLLTGGEFSAKPDPTTRWTAVWVGLLLVGLDMAIGLGLLHVRTHHIVAPHPLSTQLQEVTLGLVGVSGPLAFTSDTTADVVYAVLLALGVVTLVVVAYLVLRSPRRQPQLGADDERRIRGLLGSFGDRDSLGYFALRRDKSVIWSATGKSAIAYRVVNAVMLAGGDPIGDHEAWPGAIRAFLAEAAAHAWVPAVLGCSERGGTAYARAGLTVLELGDEAVVEVDEFTLSGRAMRSVRQAVHRVERAGYSCLVRRQHDTPPASSPSWVGWSRPGGAAAPSAGSRWRWTGSVTGATAAASRSPARSPPPPGRYCAIENPRWVPLPARPRPADPTRRARRRGCRAGGGPSTSSRPVPAVHALRDQAHFRPDG